MGFEIMLEIEAGGTSSKLNQFDEDGKLGGQFSRPGGWLTPSFNTGNTRRLLRRARRMAWWIEHEDLGRITVGR